MHYACGNLTENVQNLACAKTKKCKNLTIAIAG